jgi:GDPmannose 4,6-dehydratase
LPVGQVVVRVDERYYRPTEVDLLIGDASRAKSLLGWTPKYSLGEMVKEMIEHDLSVFQKEVLLKNSGFKTKNEFE